jgi:hypothetical protein
LVVPVGVVVVPVGVVVVPSLHCPSTKAPVLYNNKKACKHQLAYQFMLAELLDRDVRVNFLNLVAKGAYTPLRPLRVTYHKYT